MADDKPPERMSGAQSEDIACLLCFDTESAKIIRPVITPALFESKILQDIASHAIGFLDQYGEAIRDHLPDMLDATLHGSDKRKAQIYRRTIDNLYTLKDGINATYIVSQLRKFVHDQTLKTAILEAVEHIEAGKTAEAEVALEKGLKQQDLSFDAGTIFTDTKKSLSFFDDPDDGISIGIKPLDDAGVQPAPGTLFLIIAPAKKGKTWGMVHIGRHALQQKKKVLVITLEMSEKRYTQRFVQNIYSISKRQAKIHVPVMQHSESGAFVGITREEITRPVLFDKGLRKDMDKRIRAQNWPLIIKAFPTSTLTLAQYKAYLDHLERIHHFIPDVVLLDYPDLMEVDTKDIRIFLGNLFRQLRGVAVERNHALVAVTQGGRASADARTTLDTHVAEDYSKIATADVVVTYSQTKEEKRLGLARLYVSNARNDEDKFSVVIAQAYGIGQFCLDAARMGGDYWRTLEGIGRQSDDDE